MSNETENQEEIVDCIVDDINLADENLQGWDGSFGPTLPPGDYLFEVANAKIEPNKAGTGRNLVMTYRVLTEGEFYDKKVKQWLGLPGPDSKAGVAKRLAHVVRDVLEAPLLPSGGFQTISLIGRQLIATVTIEQQKSFDPVRSQEVVRDNMRIQNERRAEQAPPQQKAASAPPSKPPATQAAAGAKKPVGQQAGAAQRAR